MGKGCKSRQPLARGSNTAIVSAMRRRKIRQPADLTHSWSVLHHPFEPQSIFSQDQVAAIHQAALDILRDLGIKVLLPEAVELFEKHGAAASGDMLRIGSDMVEAALASAPQSFTLHAPNRARNLPIAPGQLIFTPGGGCPMLATRSTADGPVIWRTTKTPCALCRVSMSSINQAPRLNHKTFRCICAIMR